jgi:cleavage and polyadenylation specificity factor subunit 1
LLSHQHPKAPLALVTYVSYVAIGTSLQQKCDGHWKTLGFFSRKLPSTETRYGTYDQELLAIYAAIKFFQYLLQGRDFVIKRDNKTPGLCFHAEAG